MVPEEPVGLRWSLNARRCAGQDGRRARLANHRSPRTVSQPASAELQNSGLRVPRSGMSAGRLPRRLWSPACQQPLWLRGLPVLLGDALQASVVSLEPVLTAGNRGGPKQAPQRRPTDRAGWLAPGRWGARGSREGRGCYWLSRPRDAPSPSRRNRISSLPSCHRDVPKVNW